MSSFGGVNFRVYGLDQHHFPSPTVDSEGIPRYQATIRCASRSDLVALANKLTIATFKRARRSKSIVTHVEAGPGQATLSVPVHKGTLKTFTAVLVSLSVRGEGSERTMSTADSGAYVADAEWVIVSGAFPS